MKRKTWIALLLLPVMLLAVCVPTAEAEDEESALNVIKVEDLPEDFVCPVCKHGAVDFEKIEG